MAPKTVLSVLRGPSNGLPGGAGGVVSAEDRLPLKPLPVLRLWCVFFDELCAVVQHFRCCTWWSWLHLAGTPKKRCFSCVGGGDRHRPGWLPVRFGRDSSGVGDVDGEVVSASFSASSASFGALRSLSYTVFDAEADGGGCVAPGAEKAPFFGRRGGELGAVEVDCRCCPADGPRGRVLGL